MRKILSKQQRNYRTQNTESLKNSERQNSYKTLTDNNTDNKRMAAMTNTFQNDNFYTFVDSMKMNPDDPSGTLTDRTDLVFFSQDGSVFRIRQTQTQGKRWYILSNKLNAVGWYPVDNEFVGHTRMDFAGNPMARTVKLYEGCNTTAFPGNLGHVYHVDNITYCTSPVFSTNEYNTMKEEFSRPNGFYEDSILEDFNKREWIYLYLKNSAATTREEAVAAYCYPLIPNRSEDNIPWHSVPLGGSQQPGRNYHFDDAFPNSTHLDNLPIFEPTSDGTYKTSYEIMGMNGWFDVTQPDAEYTPEDTSFHQVQNNLTTPDHFDSWQEVEKSLEETYADELVNDVVEQILNDDDEVEDDGEDEDDGEYEDDGEDEDDEGDGEDEDDEGDGLRTPRSLSDSDVTSVASFTTTSSSYTTSSSGSSTSDSSYTTESSFDPDAEDWPEPDEDYDDWVERRFDPFDGGFYTKKEFYNYYGDNFFWNMMARNKWAERFMLETIIMRNRPLLSDANVNYIIDMMVETFM